MPTLEVDFLGFKMKNPFILASAPPTNTVEMIKRAFDAGWAGAVTKTIPLEKVSVTNTTPRIDSISFPTFEESSKQVYAFGNIELVSEKHADYWMAAVAELRKEYPDHFVMTSIMAEGDAQDDWVELAKRSEQAGACAVELNFSCPHGGMPPAAVGAAIGQDIAIASQITRWVREAVNIPVVVKLTGAVTDIKQVARAIKESGADAFCTINSFPVLLGVDLDTFSPLPSVSGKGSHCGYSGRALKQIAPHEALDIETRRISAIDLSVCTRCGKCAVSCRDAGYQAITEKDDRTPVVDEKKCDGCGLCLQVCPVWDCISMRSSAGSSAA